jgi:antitoxin (DNA-binding transcriptional repressor) of toxin-antitoxin stability system
MAVRASVTEVARRFSEFVNRVALRGERFVLIRGGRPVAELAPVPASHTLGELADVLAALPRLTPDEAAAFEADLDAARAELGPPESPSWES